MIDIDKLEALANAATPGPWTVGDDAWYEAETGVGYYRGWWACGPAHVTSSGSGMTEKDAAEADVAFIAAARDAVPALIAELRAARAEVERLRYTLDEETAGACAACARCEDDLARAMAERDEFRAEVERMRAENPREQGARLLWAWLNENYEIAEWADVSSWEPRRLVCAEVTLEQALAGMASTSEVERLRYTLDDLARAMAERDESRAEVERLRAENARMGLEKRGMLAAAERQRTAKKGRR